MERPRRKAVTIAEVAASAGVSYQTVSRVVNGHPNVAGPTRQMVQQTIARLGYRPNAFARSLVQRRTRIVGVLIARLDNHFYPRVLEELTARLWEAGRQVMYFNLDDGGDTAIPDDPFTSRFGNRAGSTAGSDVVPS